MVVDRKLEDCYFWINTAVPADERTMAVMCVECHEKNPVGWFWQGSKRGYGPFEYICELCGKLIYKPEQRETNENTSSD